MATRNNRLLTLALVAAGGLVAVKLFGEEQPPKPPTQDGSLATMTEEQYRAIAASLEQEFFAGAFEDEAAIIRLILLMHTDADVDNLEFYFGSKFRPAYFRSFTLPEAVTRFLSASDIMELNNGLRSRNINRRF